MQNTKCQKCGSDTDGHCSCGTQSAINGAAKPIRIKPSPPPELAGRVFTPTPPEMAEEIRRTFDEAAFFAEVEEVLKTGGADIDALVCRVERKAHGGKSSRTHAADATGTRRTGSRAHHRPGGGPQEEG